MAFPIPIVVVVLDDHPIIHDGIKLLLGDIERFRIGGMASDIRELLTLLAEPADILILDLNIKGKNILDQIPTIRDKNQHVKILIFSSYNTPSLVKKAFACDIQGYLLKDTTQDELLGALDTIAAGKIFIGQNVSIPKKVLNLKQPEKELVDNFEKKYNLTSREMDIIRMMAKGVDSKEMAGKLFISLHTVQSHRKNIMRKLDLHSAVDIARWALENGLV